MQRRRASCRSCHSGRGKLAQGLAHAQQLPGNDTFGRATACPGVAARTQPGSSDRIRASRACALSLCPQFVRCRPSFATFRRSSAPRGTQCSARLPPCLPILRHKRQPSSQRNVLPSTPGMYTSFSRPHTAKVPWQCTGIPGLTTSPTPRILHTRATTHSLAHTGCR